MNAGEKGRRQLGILENLESFRDSKVAGLEKWLGLGGIRDLI